MQEENYKLDKESAPETNPVISPATLSIDGSFGAYTSDNEQHKDDEGSLRELSRQLRKRKWLIITFVTLVTCVVTIESFRAKPFYQATTTIVVEKDNATVIKAGDFVFQSDDSELIKTEMLILKTSPLLEDVVVRLKLDQNPRFLDAAQLNTRWNAIGVIFGKFLPPSHSEAPPPLIEKTVIGPDRG
jgi:uncharacterized protein involved in exopolysaccharide biosynthesis